MAIARADKENLLALGLGTVGAAGISSLLDSYGPWASAAGGAAVGLAVGGIAYKVMKDRRTAELESHLLERASGALGIDDLLNELSG